MSTDTDSGLPVRQLLKMVASGHLSPAEFKQRLTKHVIGWVCGLTLVHKSASKGSC